MTLVSSIIVSSYRDANIVSNGGSITTDEMNEGLLRLQSLVASVFGNDVGENLTDFPLGNYGRSDLTQLIPDLLYLQYPPINSRILATAEQAMTVNFPTYPSDGSRMMVIDPFSNLQFFPITLDGNGRTIEGQPTLLLNDDGLSRIWFFNSDKGDWVRVVGFTSTDEMPFPIEFDDYFIISLAMRLNPSYGRSLSAESLKRFNQQQSQLFARYAQSAPLQINPDVSYTSRQSYRNGWTGEYSSQENWNVGWPGGRP